jgi:hypothetical protein
MMQSPAIQGTSTRMGSWGCVNTELINPSTALLESSGWFEDPPVDIHSSVSDILEWLWYPVRSCVNPVVEPEFVYVYVRTPDPRGRITCIRNRGLDRL